MGFFGFIKDASSNNGDPSGSKFIGVYLGLILGLVILQGSILVSYGSAKDIKNVPANGMSLLGWASVFAGIILTLLLGTKAITHFSGKNDSKDKTIEDETPNTPNTGGADSPTQ